MSVDPGGGFRLLGEHDLHTWRSFALVEAEFAAIRSRVAFLEADRYLAPDIEAMRLWALHADGRTCPALLAGILPSQRGALSRSHGGA